MTSNSFGSSPEGKRRQTIKAYVVSSHVNIAIQRQKSRVPIVTVANMPRSACFFISYARCNGPSHELPAFLTQIITRETGFRICDALGSVDPSPHPTVFLCYSHRTSQSSEMACECVPSEESRRRPFYTANVTSFSMLIAAQPGSCSSSVEMTLD